MSSTFLSLHYHLVFSTKGRRPYMADPWRERLFEYLGGTVNGLNGVVQAVGGTADHVHLLVTLKATHCLANFMRDLKRSSSIWVHETIGMPNFSWREGYGAFSVSATAREQVKLYIANQAEHHRTKSFREELKELIERACIPYNEQWLD